MNIYTNDTIKKYLAAIEAAKATQWQQFLYRKWLRNQG
jgi:hypothetical protein